MPFAGRPVALRQWAAQAKLPEVPGTVSKAFLLSAPGKVFDASNAAGKFVVVSSDDGICAVVTDHAGDRETANGLEAALGSAGVTFRMVIERNDKDNPKLHHREYLATRHGRAWRILAATVHDQAAGGARGEAHGEAHGEAMLTAAPQ
jgi:hypothetical protein